MNVQNTAEGPAKGRQCKKCNKLNHFAVKCRTRNLNEVQETHSHSDQSEEAGAYFLAL